MRYSVEECLTGLTQAAELLGESPSKAAYESLGIKPSSGTIIRTVGGWNAAKRDAGLETNPTSGSRTQEKPPDVTVSVDENWDDLTVDQRWYYKNRDEDNRYEGRRRASLRKWITSYKVDHNGCRSCSETDPACIDFHHVDPDEKVMAINKMVPMGFGRTTIRSEMEKCDLLCSNCHLKLHRSQFNLGAVSSGHRQSSETATRKRHPRLSEWPKTERGRRAWSFIHRRTVGCRECGESDPRCLQFHHIDQLTKVGGIGQMISDGCTHEELREEVERCSVLCSNCHRKYHQSERKRSSSVAGSTDN